MAADNLTLEISPSLLEAMGIPGTSGKLDYFSFFGVTAENCPAPQVERAVMERSKALRQWQNSPQHGKEAIKLLPMLHRIAAVLKDPTRREAYMRELERLLSGAKVDPRAEYQDMVRAAMADGRIDDASKAALFSYASSHGIPMGEAGRILNEITAASAAAASKPEDAELFLEEQVSAARSGPQAFRVAVESLLENACLNPETAARIVQDSGRFGVSRADGASIVVETSTEWFRNIVKQVARGGALNDNQARLLMPKAKGIGLDEKIAFEVLSDYTFTSASQEDLANLHLSTPSFDPGDIAGLLSKQKTVLAVRRFEFLRRLLGGGALRLAVIAAAVVGVGYGATQFLLPMLGAGGGGRPGLAASPTPVGTPTPAPKPWSAQKPDPPSGLIEVSNEKVSDPPAFLVKITSVTCAEYQEFVDKTLRTTAPASWGIALHYPEGMGALPVTGVSAKDAEDYCDWVAKEKGMAAGEVRLPTIAEYQRLLRFPADGGVIPAEEGAWRKLELHKSASLYDPRKKKTDILYLPAGQVYDLLGNAAEWSVDEKDGQRAVLGGDYAQTDMRFDLNTPRYADPQKPSPTIGFRYVIAGKVR